MKTSNLLLASGLTLCAAIAVGSTGYVGPGGQSDQTPAQQYQSQKQANENGRSFSVLQFDHGSGRFDASTGAANAGSPETQPTDATLDGGPACFVGAAGAGDSRTWGDATATCSGSLISGRYVAGSLVAAFDNTGPDTGDATFVCQPDGSVSAAAEPGSSCSPGLQCQETTINWAPGCASIVAAAPNNSVRNLTNSEPLYVGSASVSCTEGGWVIGSESCDLNPDPIPCFNRTIGWSEGNINGAYCQGETGTLQDGP